MLIALLVLVAFIIGAAIYGLNQSAVRISHVDVFGISLPLAGIAEDAMQGKYLGIIPYDSIIFYPDSLIRSRIISAYPDIATVSIFRSSLTSISIKVNNRVPIARWCGTATDVTRFDLNASSTRLNLVMTAATNEGCYVFDDSGVIFATTTELQLVNPFVVYGPIVNADAPVGSKLALPEQFPFAFNFARQLSTFGSPATAVAFRDGQPSGQVGEVDIYLASGTRVTYVLGNEDAAFTALTSAKDNFNLANGSLDYIDLRFDGKMYLKKK